MLHGPPSIPRNIDLAPRSSAYRILDAIGRRGRAVRAIAHARLPPLLSQTAIEPNSGNCVPCRHKNGTHHVARLRFTISRSICCFRGWFDGSLFCSIPHQSRIKSLMASRHRHHQPSSTPPTFASPGCGRDAMCRLVETADHRMQAMYHLVCERHLREFDRRWRLFVDRSQRRRASSGTAPVTRL
jgi:hypothetical protein